MRVGFTKMGFKSAVHFRLCFVCFVFASYSTKVKEFELFFYLQKKYKFGTGQRGDAIY